MMILHKSGFIHRNLSPGNIIIGDVVKISDLEFVKACKVEEPKTLTKCGIHECFVWNICTVSFFSLAAVASSFIP